MKLTQTLIATNDIARRISLGATAKLYILFHDLDAGYTVGPRIKRGWNIEKGEKGAVNLEAPELPGITPEDYQLCAGFGLWEKNLARQRGMSATQLAVIKVNNRTPPLGEFSRMWAFDVSHTSEQPVDVEP